MNTIYSSIGDIESRVVVPVLGEYADEYDTEAIARDVAQRVDVPHPADGRTNANRSGWIVGADGPDFWAIVGQYAL